MRARPAAAVRPFDPAYDAALSTRNAVVIVGGGVIGSAIASFLSADGSGSEVTVIERDFSYERASSALSASSIRQQFSSVVNIRMSQFGIEFLRAIGDLLRSGDERPDIGLVEPGYLYLATEAGASRLAGNHAVQRAAGADVELLLPDALRSRFPWLRTEGIGLGCLGASGEGWFDGYSVLQAFRRKARSNGVRYVEASAVGFERDARGRITAVKLQPKYGGASVPADLPPAGAASLPCNVVVNAAGPWAAAVAGWAGIDLPVRARRRSVFSFRCPDTLPGCPLLIDTSGIWFRPEGNQFLCGFAPPAHRDADEPPLDVEHEAFDEVIRPALAERVPAFEAVRLTGAWAGYYEMNTFDQNAILGLHPDCENLYFANGFSGHGMQHAPAVGRGVAELIRDGRYRTLDLSDLGFERVLHGRPLLEQNVI
jgi:FAD-dependent oxidoreductase domain-containing protein 1